MLFPRLRPEKVAPSVQLRHRIPRAHNRFRVSGASMVNALDKLARTPNTEHLGPRNLQHVVAYTAIRSYAFSETQPGKSGPFGAVNRLS